MNEIYVYGDFEGTVKALQMVAMIFEQNSYSGLFFSVLVLTIVFSALTIYTDKIIGLQSNPAIIAKKVFLALLLLLVLVVPKGTIFIYDPVKNKTQSVGNVPQGIILFSGIVNKVFIGLKDIIETAGSPIISFNDLGYGKGFQMLNAVPVLYSSLSNASPGTQENISNYIEDCVYMALSRRDILSENLYKTNNLWAELKTDYLVFNTVINGNVMTCSSAYNAISTEFNTKINEIMTSFCHVMEYDSSPVQQQQCRTKFSSLFNSFIANGVNETQIVSSYIAAKSMVDLAANNNDIYAKTLAERNMVGSQLGAGSLGEIYLPYIQSLMSILLVCLFPIVVLLMLIAPSESFKWYFGMYIWILMWGLIDVIFNVIIEDKAYTIFTEYRNNGGLGMEYLLNLNSYSVKILGMYSNLRWMGASLSATMAYGILKFGGQALASIAGNIGGSVQSAGASVGQALAMPGGGAMLQKGAYDKAVAASKDIRQMFTPQYIDSDVASSVISTYSQRAYAEGLTQLYGGDPTKAGGEIGASRSVKTAAETETTKKSVEQSGGQKGYVALSSTVGSEQQVNNLKTIMSAIEKIQDKQGISFEEASQRYFGREAMTKGAEIMSDYALASNFGEKFFKEGKFEYDKFLDWKAKGMILDEEMATTLKQNTGYNAIEGQKVLQFGINNEGKLAFFVGDKEGNGASIITKGFGQEGYEIQNGKYSSYVKNQKDESVLRKGAWEQSFKFSNLAGIIQRTFGKEVKFNNDFGKDATIAGTVTSLGDGVFRLTSGQIGKDGNFIKTNMNGFLDFKRDERGNFQILGGSGLSILQGENQLDIGSMQDGKIVAGQLISGDTKTRVDGNQIEQIRTLSNNEKVGGYTILPGSRVITRQSDKGETQTLYEGNFVMNGELYNGTLAQQGNEWVFVTGETGDKGLRFEGHTSTYSGPDYGRGAIANDALENGKLAQRTIQKINDNGNTRYVISKIESMEQATNYSELLSKIFSDTGVAQSSYAVDYGYGASGSVGTNLFLIKVNGDGFVNVKFGDSNYRKSQVDYWTRYDLVAQESAMKYALEQATGKDGKIDEKLFYDTYTKSLNAARNAGIEMALSSVKNSNLDYYGQSPIQKFTSLLEFFGLKETEADKFTKIFKKGMEREFNPQQPQQSNTGGHNTNSGNSGGNKIKSGEEKLKEELSRYRQTIKDNTNKIKNKPNQQGSGDDD